MARKKVRAKDLKKQRWATIVAAILALGMIVSLVGVYLGQAGSNRTALPEQQQEPQPEDYLAFYEGEVERLEKHLDENEPTEPVLLELAENYRYLVFIQQVFFEDQQVLAESRENLAAVFEELLEINPEQNEYRYELISLSMDMDSSHDQINAQVEDLLDRLHEKPDPMVHLALINLLAPQDEEGRYEEEIEWLRNHLEPLHQTESANNEELFYYAVLIGEYYDQQDEAADILEQIIDQEPEDSSVYQDATTYLSYLETESIPSGENID